MIKVNTRNRCEQKVNASGVDEQEGAVKNASLCQFEARKATNKKTALWLLHQSAVF
jgi:hypothetical protein